MKVKRQKNSQIILREARYIREGMVRQYSEDLKGYCYVASSILGARLYKFDLEPHLIEGFIVITQEPKHPYEQRPRPHYWLEIQGKILDLTADQFNNDPFEAAYFPEILFDNYRTWKCYQKRFTYGIPIPIAGQLGTWGMKLINRDFEPGKRNG